MMPDTVMFFAAGFGTRMRHLTADTPKPLVPLNGRPMMDHAIDLACEAGISTKIANAHYLADQIVDHLAARDIEVHVEADEILDTGGGLKAILHRIPPGPLFTMNSDAVWIGPNPLTQLRAAWDPERMDALMMLIPPTNSNDPTLRGDFACDAEGRLSRGPGAIYGGLQIIDPTHVAAVPDRVFSLNTVWDEMIDRGRLFGISYPGRWFDIGTPEGLADAEDQLGGRDV